jgi:WS/DGAT C-terminal domain
MITAMPRRRCPVRIGLVQFSVQFRTRVRIELKRSGNLETETPTKHSTRHVRAMVEWGIRTGSVALPALMVCPGKSPLNGLSSRDRRLVIFDLSRSELRLVAQQFYASVYAVLLRVTAGAIRRFHASCGSAFHDLITAVAIPGAVRRRSTDLGNHVEEAWVPPPILVATPVERLCRTEAFLSRARTQGVVGLLAAVIARLPVRMRSRVCRIIRRNISMACAVVPGLPGQRFVAGARVEGTYGTPAHVDGHGVSFSFVTYRDSVHFSLLSVPCILKNPDLLKRDVVEATAELVTLASDSRVPA